MPEEIETQLRLYDNLKNDDLDELSSKWNRVQSDFTDVNSAFQVRITHRRNWGVLCVYMPTQIELPHNTKCVGRMTMTSSMPTCKMVMSTQFLESICAYGITYILFIRYYHFDGSESF